MKRAREDRFRASATSLLSAAVGRGRPKDDEALADHLARAIFLTYPDGGKMDSVQVTVAQGFDLGIAET